MHVGAKMSTQAARALLLVLVLTLAIAGLTPRAQAQEALLAGAPSSPVAVFQPLTRDRPIFASFGGPSGFSAPIVVGAPPATDLQVVGNARGDAIAYWLRAAGGAPVAARRSAGESAFAGGGDLSGSTGVPDAAMNAHGDAVISTRDMSWWWTSGGAPGAIPAHPGATAVGLDDAGLTVGAGTHDTPDGSRRAFSSTSLVGGPWTERHVVGDQYRFSVRLAVSGRGLALLLLTSREFNTEAWVRRPGTEQWVLEHVFLPGFIPDALAIGDTGHAVVVSQTAVVSERREPLLASVREPDGTWTSSQTIAVGPSREFWPSAAVDQQGAIAIAWRTFQPFAISAAYRPPGGTFTAQTLYRHRVRGDVPGAAPGLVVGGGRALAAWQQPDGDRVTMAVRFFGEHGPGRPATIATVRQWRRLAPPSACRPRRSRTVSATRDARLYTSPGLNSVVGCLFKRGVPVAVGNPVEGRSPVTAQAGPLVAVFDESFEADETRYIQLAVTDLRDPNYGINFQVPLVRDAEVSAVVLNPRGGIAWIECERCADPHATFAVYALDSDLRIRQPRRLARGRRIGARSLRVRGSRLTWTDGGKRVSARLR